MSLIIDSVSVFSLTLAGKFSSAMLILLLFRRDWYFFIEMFDVKNTNFSKSILLFNKVNKTSSLDHELNNSLPMLSTTNISELLMASQSLLMS